MDYTIVVVTKISDPLGLAYIAPYAATSIAEHFMEAGRDVNHQLSTPNQAHSTACGVFIRDGRNASEIVSGDISLPAGNLAELLQATASHVFHVPNCLTARQGRAFLNAFDDRDLFKTRLVLALVEEPQSLLLTPIEKRGPVAIVR